MTRVQHQNNTASPCSLSTLLPSVSVFPGDFDVHHGNLGAKYSYLCRERREIRLLKVHGSRTRRPSVQPQQQQQQRQHHRKRLLYPHLSGALKTVSLSDKPAYLAVSYTWNDHHAGNRDIYIDINGLRTMISHNLYSLLLEVCDKKDSEWVWVDSICINQNDAMEKKWQIRLMADIYAQASATIIWLGLGTVGELRAMKFIGKLTEKKLIRILRSVDKRLTTIDGDEACKTPTSNLRRRGFGQVFESSLERAAHSLSVFSDSPSQMDFLLSLRALLAHSWWGRRWVVQEAFLSKIPLVALAPKPRFSLSGHCRNDRDRYDRPAFGAIAANMDNFAKLAMWHEKYVSENPGVHQSIKSLFLDCPFHSLLKKWLSFRAGGVAVYRAPLPKWLALTRLFKQSLPRDALFGLLSLSSPYDQLKIDPDYTSPDEIIFQCLFMHVVQTYGFVRIDTFLPCLPKALLLPSWCLDGNSRHLGRVSSPLTAPGHGRPFRAGGEAARRVHFAYNDTLEKINASHPERLKSSIGRGIHAVVGGFEFDEVTAMIPTGLCSNYSLQPELGSLQDRVKASVLNWEQRLSCLHESPYGNQEVQIQALALTLLGGCTGQTTNEEWTRRFQDWTLGRTHSDTATDSFYTSIRSRCLNRALIITSAGFVGLVSLDCRVGDTVAIFLGSPIPFLLRRAEKSLQYTLLGECYIHGIMHGEAAVGKDIVDFTIW
ncbi:hypothetical protein QQS21_000199 [Conoideocrella luteorostrata]|uniref:Heterokaryon incompatibility domain-containing protein n=1 Tax=Conoideocrella luteorostrata TaxID=1105319 RepID=A0AAJ0G2P1_9HYPO|nr:hypothetical protein QQS21_000199 [Conoideocrella luteorostrata]